MIDDAARKITLYSNLANALLLGGVVLMIVAVWMFFHFGAPRMIARVTGYGARKEREKFLKEQQKNVGAEKPPSGNPAEAYPSGDTGSRQAEYAEAYASPERKEETAPMSPAASAGSSAQDEAPDAAAMDGDVDMSVWDNTSALKAMLEKAGDSGKRYIIPKDKPETAKPETAEKKEESIRPISRKPAGTEPANAPVFVETGLLGEKSRVMHPGTKAPERPSSGDTGTGVLKKRQADAERTRDESAEQAFRIVRCIRISATIPESAGK